MNDSTLPPSERVTTSSTAPSNANATTNNKDTSSSSSRETTVASKETTTKAATIKKAPSSSRSSRKKKQGFGLSDWNLLLRRTNDLAQRNGKPLRHDITLEELKEHNSIHDGWIVLNGNKVYNITPYLHYHPGGANILKQVLGKKDLASTLYQKYHPWVNADGLIGKLHIGYLAPERQNNDDDDETTKASYIPKQMLTSDGFPIPAPRPPKNTSSSSSKKVPSALTTSSKDMDGDDEEEEDFNPWER